MHQLDTALREFLPTSANLTARGRAALIHHSEPGSQALLRLLEPAKDPQRANDGLVVTGDGLVRANDRRFNRLRVADADEHELIDEYVFSIYQTPPT
jgi:hypothetical protein